MVELSPAQSARDNVPYHPAEIGLVKISGPSKDPSSLTRDPDICAFKAYARSL